MLEIVSRIAEQMLQLCGKGMTFVETSACFYCQCR